MPAAHHGHSVQFYDQERYLVEAVSDYAGAGLSARNPVVIVATSEHRRAFVERLSALGVDADRAEHERVLTLLDARQTMASFMVDGLPDPHRFESSFGAMLESRRRAFPRSPLRAYGEMVDLLWGEANTEGALRLEELWNALAATHEFSLLCAYAMSRFPRAADADGFAAICRQHTEVRPAEGVPGLGGSDEPARALARLQQRASALEAEIEQRRWLEQTLRDALEQGRRTAALLEEAVRARDEFISIASHELRNPLHAIHLQILSALDSAGRGTLTSEWALTRLGRTRDSVTRLSRLLDNLLDASRITAGRLALELRDDVDFAGVVRSVVDRSRELLGGVSLTLRIEPVIGRWDPLRLDQIVTNLLSNALKYGAGNPITIRLSAAGGTATLEVEDQGIGIGEAQRSRLFGRFERGLASRQEGGFGLGLWITRQIVEAMGGAIEVRGAAGRGSVFSVTLPRTSSNVSNDSNAGRRP
jgi:signal transduction histidine kinase